MTSGAHSSVSRSNPAPLLVAGFLLALSLAASLVWFWSLPVHLDTFAEDDLRLLRAQESGTAASSLRQALTDTAAEKYRPVASVLYWLTFEAFGDAFRPYVLLNTLLHSGLAAAMGFVVWRFAGVSLWAAAGLTLLAAISRFSFYNVVQRHGLMEIVALALAGTALTACCIHSMRGERRFAVVALVAFGLCIHTHERYLTLAPLLVVSFYWNRGLGKLTDWLLVLAPLLLVAANVLVKETFLRIAFLTGTGGQHVDLGQTEITSFFGAGLASVLALDVGPAYLSALDFRSLGGIGYVPITMVVFGAGGLLVIASRAGGLNRRVLMLLTAAMAVLLLSASLTFRQEYRWLFAAELTFLGGVTVLSGAAGGHHRKLRLLAVSLVFLGTAAADLMARRSAQNIFFMDWLANSESARATVIEATGPQLAYQPIYLIDGELSPLFFEEYAPGITPTVIPLASGSIDRLSKKEIEDGIFFTRQKGRWQLVSVKPSGQGVDLPASDLVTPADIALIPELRELVPKAPGSWYYTYQVGLQFMTRNPRKAEHYIREAIAMVGSGNPYPYFHLGQLFHQRGDLKEALKYYELAARYDAPPSRFIEVVDSVKKAIAASVPKGS
jgi:hypothetical protein